MRILSAVFFLPITLFALYSGNPSLPMMPEQGAWIPKDCWFGIKAGYVFDDVYDRKLKFAGKGSDPFHKKVLDQWAISNFGVLTLNFNDRVELFFPLGEMSSKLNQYPLPGTKVSYRTNPHFAWGAGARAILAYWGNVQFGLNVDYVQSNSPLASIKVNGASTPTEGAKSKFREWQVGGAVSYRLSWFIPYIGMDYSNYRNWISHLNSLDYLFPMKRVAFHEQYGFGMYLGFGLAANKAFAVNVEARFFNENAVSASADFKF